ncbi:MAG TPA: hypothetical protein VHZ98_12745 [Galbitalea sp.]|jgi:hypothetical protein|nr:hypothetical protein [Galbitalea sp.]
MDTLGIVAIFAIYILPIAFGFVILWWIIRTAVRRALRDHQLWLESRSSGPDEQSTGK